MAAAGATDEELERQAQDMAEKALPVSLPEAVRAAKLPQVKSKILERLKSQRNEAAMKPLVPVGQAGPPPGTIRPTGAPVAPGPPSSQPPPPPPGSGLEDLQRVDGVELCGDEPWFADATIRRRLREFVADAHKEQKILVAAPAEEVARICPADGRVLGAGAVLRLGGAHLGGYGESDVAYAYRQLSRALHPDKNPDIANAPAAFHRLSEAADELRQGLSDQRAALQLLVATMGGQATQEMLSRPQEALLAEACRLLMAVCGAAGEGEVPLAAQGRIYTAFQRSSIFYTCQMQALLSEWFERTQLLDVIGGSPLRTAYDCAAKRFRAQFLCLLNRVLVVEAKRCSGCVRGGWSQVMQMFPELGLWRELRERLQHRVWDASVDGPEPPEVQTRSRSRGERRSRSRRRRSGDDEKGDERRKRDGKNDDKGPEFKPDPWQHEKDMKWESRWRSSDDMPGGGPPQKTDKATRESSEAKRRRRKNIERNPATNARACRWARKWRAAIAAVLPSPADKAASRTDPELRKLVAVLWKEIVAWAIASKVDRGLGLFKADHQTADTFGWDGKDFGQGTARGLQPGTPPAEWAFLPAEDILLLVGEAIVGSTAEGMFAENSAGHKRLKFADCYKKRGSGNKRKGDEKGDKRNSKWDERE